MIGHPHRHFDSIGVYSLKLLYFRSTGLKRTNVSKRILRQFLSLFMITNTSNLSRTVIAIVALCSMGMITRVAFSQRLISYQGIVTQSALPLNGPHTVTFKIYPR